MGYQALALAYQKHLDTIFSNAGIEAVERWLTAHRQPAKLDPVRSVD